MFTQIKTPLLILVVLTMFVVPVPSYRAEAIVARTLNLSKQDVADLMGIEKYLDGLKTMKARFLQMSSDGDYSEGMIYLSRPGRIRIEYDPPSPILIIADGSNLIYIDKEINQATAVFLSLTPADLILREKLSFSSEGVLLTGFHHSPGVIRISLVKADDPLDGQLTLVFSDMPLELRKWTVDDAQGVKTTVSLLGPRFAVRIDKSLFDYEMPSAINNDQ